MPSTLKTRPRRCGRPSGLRLSATTRQRISRRKVADVLVEEWIEAERDADPIVQFRLAFEESNYAFDVSRSRFDDGLITADEMLDAYRAFVDERRSILADCRQHLLALGRPIDYANEFARRLTGRR